MTYNPNIHHRHSIRLKGYDYSQFGLYFITICVKDRVCLFGNVGAPLVGAQYNNDSQNNGVTNNVNTQNVGAQNNDIVQNDLGADNIIGSLDDDGQNGRPQGHAPTHDATDVPTHAPLIILNDSENRDGNHLMVNYGNEIIGNTLFVMNNRIKPFLITSLTIRPNGRTINFSINEIV